jgi:hypothetical protein
MIFGFRVLVAVLLPLLGLVKQASGVDDYAFLVHHEIWDDSCYGDAVSIKGVVPDESSFWLHGVTASTCSEAALCIQDADSEQCTGLEVVKLEMINITFNEDDVIQGCWWSDLGTRISTGCVTKSGDECKASTTYPDCRYNVKTQSEVFGNPDMLKNTNGAPGFAHQNYEIYYSDSSCSQAEGLKSRVEGSEFTQMALDESVSCADAMACLYQEDSAKCQSYGAEDGRAFVVGRQEICDVSDNVTCTEVPASECQQSTVYPNCYVKLVDAETFFANPAAYLTSSSLADETTPTEDEDEDDGGNSFSFVFGALGGAAALVVVGVILRKKRTLVVEGEHQPN